MRKQMWVNPVGTHSWLCTDWGATSSFLNLVIVKNKHLLFEARLSVRSPWWVHALQHHFCTGVRVWMLGSWELIIVFNTQFVPELMGRAACGTDDYSNWAKSILNFYERLTRSVLISIKNSDIVVRNFLEHRVWIRWSVIADVTVGYEVLCGSSISELLTINCNCSLGTFHLLV